MKQFYLLFILALSPFVMTVADGNKRVMEGLAMASDVLGQEIRYSVVLPQDYYRSRKSYPVVYLLHGLGDDESSWLEYGRITQVADDAVSKREIVPMIYIMPQGFRNYYVNDYAGLFLYEDMFINELVPHIDKTYRTIPDSLHRAVMGYSMGGFGALMLPARHPDVFSVSVPLSISVRTDAQYMVEAASEWNDQWGRLFGGVGKTGEERITTYYKQYSPFHFFNKANAQAFRYLRLFIDNGDDEYTLCRSNEELHILLRDLNIKHEFRVRNGGHSFTYWREALPNALRFISNAFENQAYRGDIVVAPQRKKFPKVEILDRETFSVILPPGYEGATRKYPVVYLFDDFTADRMQVIGGLVHQGIEDGIWPEMILIFIRRANGSFAEQIIPQIETDYNARSGYRFRALIGFEEGGVTALQNALIRETFTSVVLFDAPVDVESIKEALTTDKPSFKRTWMLISNTDTDLDYETNGMAHILLREEDVYHEYRVVEGGRSVQVSNDRLKEAFQFTSDKIHR
jgi:enterochelin esterase-like enzyme